MALPTSDLTIEGVYSVLNSRYAVPIKMADCFTIGTINKYGLNPAYVAGSTPNARLATLQTTPYKLGHFRGYDHSAVAPTSDSSIFIDVGTLQLGWYIEGTIKAYNADDDTQIGLSVQVINLISNTTFNLYNLSGTYYIVWNLTIYNGLNQPQSTSISWTESFTSASGYGNNSGDWSSDTSFTVFVS